MSIRRRVEYIFQCVVCIYLVMKHSQPLDLIMGKILPSFLHDLENSLGPL